MNTFHVWIVQVFQHCGLSCSFLANGFNRMESIKAKFSSNPGLFEWKVMPLYSLEAIDTIHKTTNKNWASIELTTSCMVVLHIKLATQNLWRSFDSTHGRFELSALQLQELCVSQKHLLSWPQTPSRQVGLSLLRAWCKTKATTNFTSGIGPRNKDNRASSAGFTK